MPTIDRYSPGRLRTRRLGLLGVVAALTEQSIHFTDGAITLVAHARAGKTSGSLASNSLSGGLEPAPVRSSSGGGGAYLPPRTSTSLSRDAFWPVVIKPASR